MASRPCILFAAVLIATILSVAQSQAPADADDWLTAHNAARSAEGVGLASLAWSDSAYLYALSWAQSKAATDGCFGHSEGGSYGENIFWDGDATRSTPTSVVARWVAEKENYTYGSNACVLGQMCGHYTQVVWTATTSVGCASALCSVAGKFFICSYDPRGNNGSRPY